VGRRSQERRTGLTLEKRIQRSIKRRQKGEEMRMKEGLELAKAIAESSALPSPLPPLPVFDRQIMRELLGIERRREQEKKEQKT